MQDKKVICSDVDGNKEEVSAKDLSFRPSAYGITIKDGKVLLFKQWDGYDFPGGGIDLGEEIKEGLKREVKEETGLDVSVGKVVACENSFFKTPFENRLVHSILMYYLCEVTGGELSKANLDQYEKTYADMPEWVGLDKIEKVKFYNSVNSVKIIKDAVELLNCNCQKNGQ